MRKKRPKPKRLQVQLVKSSHSTLYIFIFVVESSLKNQNKLLCDEGPRGNLFYISFLRILPLDEFFYVANSFQILQNHYLFSIILFRIMKN